LGQYDPDSHWDDLRAADGESTEPEHAMSRKGNSREGKIHVGAYLDPQFRRSIRLVQAATDRDMQALMAEALNDLFRKYGVPEGTDERAPSPPRRNEPAC
jgi:hypothetical protein